MNLQISKPIEAAGGGNARPRITGHPWPHIIHHVLRLAWLLALLSLPWRAMAAETTTSLLQKGLFEEEANQNLEAAIQNYQLVISQADEERKLAATAVFRLGECYRKKGLTNEAVAQYQRLMRDYSDQATLAKMSQQNLAGLGLGSVTLPNGAAIIGPAEFQQRVLTLLENVQTNVTKKKVREDLQELSIKEVDEEAKEIEKLAKIIKDSPDLINGTSGQSIPLIRAAEKDWLKVSRYILENKADPNVLRTSAVANDMPYTALYIAVQRNNVEMVKLLLSYHADPNKGQRLPLCQAAEAGNLDIAALLINAKASVNSVSVVDCAPLYKAVANGHKSMTELLYRNGADLNHRTDREYRSSDEHGFTALHFAVKYNRIALLEWLCDNKAEVNIRTDNDISPLLLAVWSRNQDAVACLLKYHAEVNPQALSQQHSQPTPLLAAINTKDFSIIKLLLENGANPNGNQLLGHDPQWDGFPLNAAIDTAQDEIVDLLLKNKAQVDIPNFPPLMFAINLGKGSMVKLLLEAGCPVKIAAVIDRALFTPLTLAAHRNLNDIAELLIKSGADADKLSGAGQAPLHLAVMNANTNLVALLAEKANPNILDATVQTPLDIVLRRINELNNQTSKKEQESPASRPSRQVRRKPGLEPPIDMAPPVVLRPGSAPRSNIEASLAECQEMARILRAHGARDEFSRQMFIQAQYANGEPARVFQKDKAGLNRFTLLEALSFCPEYLLSDYPDWMKVTIRRWNSQTRQETTVECPLPKTEEEAAAWKDIVLEWGDIVCIAERVYRTGEQRDKDWPKALLTALESGKREMNLIQQGETNKVIIPLRQKLAFINIDAPGTPFASQFDTGSQSSPWLISTIYSSGKLLNTSDITRVKVVRKQGGATHEWNYDLSQVKFPEDLWLQDGDEIFIPDREK